MPLMPMPVMRGRRTRFIALTINRSLDIVSPWGAPRVPYVGPIGQVTDG
jgi:hypothetical protein